MTDLSWETEHRRVAYSCSGFDVVNERVRLPNGETTEFDYLSEGESVVVLPVTTDGRVVVIEEWRQAVERRNRGLPAGSVEDGEEPNAAARREVREETGYEVGRLDHMTTVEPANGFADAVFHYYVANGCEPTASQELDDDESIAVDTTTRAALREAVRRDELRDGRAAFAILYDALFGDGRS